VVQRESSIVVGALPRALVRLEPYAVKVARTVLRERGDGDTTLLPVTFLRFYI